MDYLNNNLENYASYMSDNDLFETFKDNTTIYEGYNSKCSDQDSNELKSKKVIYDDKLINKIRDNLILNCGCTLDEGDDMLNLIIGNEEKNIKDEIEILSNEVDKKCVLNNLNNLKTYFENRNLKEESEEKEVIINLNQEEGSSIIKNKDNKLKIQDSLNKEITPENNLILEEEKSDKFTNFICLVIFLLVIIYLVKFII